MDRRLGGRESLSDRGEEEIHAPVGNETTVFQNYSVYLLAEVS
jgi:hypothetical protein